MILIIGNGEVGGAHFRNLTKAYLRQVFIKDKGPEVKGEDGFEYHLKPEDTKYLLIATQCDPKNMGEFYSMVKEYCDQFQPKIVDILTTTPPGTCRAIQGMVKGIEINKSSTRGMHPNLEEFLIDIPKHIGGPSAKELEAMYEGAGWKTILHEKPVTVELAHILNNIIYGINIIAADEAARICREYSVDYVEIMKYRQSQNEGFIKAGWPSKVSPILLPLNGGKVGGHCVSYCANIVSKDKYPLTNILARYNDNLDRH